MLREVVTQNYLPGVSSEASRDAGSCLEMVLQGPPWSQNSSYNLVKSFNLNFNLCVSFKKGKRMAQA